MTSAVPSLIRLSAGSTVRSRRGSVRASAVTAAASVRATAAPSTHAGPHGRPNACATTATAAAVAITSTVLAKMMPRRFLRISRRDVVRLSQYSSAGRKRNSIASGGRCARRSAGINPSSTPQPNSRTGGATRKRRATKLQTSTATPRTTTSTTSHDYPPGGVLAEGKRVGFSAGVEEGDLEGVLGDGTMLADELVQPRFDNRAVAVPINVNTLRRSR